MTAAPRRPRAAMPAVAGLVAAALAGAVLLAGCAQPGAPRSPAQLLLPAAAGLDDTAGAFPSARGWSAMGDPALDALIDTALAGQPG